jgi:DNA-binding PadR family transcriptional regulator
VRKSLLHPLGERSQFADADLATIGLTTSIREPREGSVTFQISRRGREYLKTAQTLLRAAEKMANRAIASQLKALADDYKRRAETTSHIDATKASARWNASQNKIGIDD